MCDRDHCDGRPILIGAFVQLVMVVTEHVLLVFKALLEWAVPDVPANVRPMPPAQSHKQAASVAQWAILRCR